MSKVLAASCVANVVTAGVPPLPLPLATIQSKGIGSSTGVAIIDEDKAYYIPNQVSNLETLIDKLIEVIDQAKVGLDKAVLAVNKAASALTLVDAKPTGGTGSAPTPVAAADIVQIGTNSAQITTATAQMTVIKTALTTLKGSLI